MTVGEVASLGGVVVIALGLVATWHRNGRASSEKYGALTQEIKQTNKILGEQNQKLNNIEKAVSGQAVNCATISSTLAEKVRQLEKGQYGQ